MTAPSTIPTGARQALAFGYDSQSRRVAKVVSNWTGSAWSRILDQRFLYDGWNLVAELNATNNALIRSYLWGLELSGSPQGAGGVGGLLALNDAATGVSFAGYDGNGNVVALVAADGTTSGRYDHDSFGQSIRLTGTRAASNPVRSRSKYFDEESGMSYYGFRFLRLDCGRWPNRDPVEERGGINLYVYVANAPSTRIDLLGLQVIVQRDPRPCARCGLGTGTPHVQEANCNVPVIRCRRGSPSIDYGNCDINCFRECVTRHEESHIATINRLCPYICRNCYLGETEGRIPVLQDSDVADQDACLAEATELNCLNALLSTAPPGCKMKIEQERERVQLRLQEHHCQVLP